MSKVAVVYWSSTGNTETMAELVARGVRNGGGEAEVISAADFTDPEGYDAIAFGCPAMGAEELEDGEFLPMFEGCAPKLGNKPVGLFGSYGWGDGEWMRTWEESCRNQGISLVGEGVICCEAPDEEAEARCIALGEQLA